jgi:hypothetical protein
MNEELKKEWRKQFEANFLDGDSMYDCGNATFSVDGVLDVCEFFLAKQQEEFVKIIDGMQKTGNYGGKSLDLKIGYNQCIADIKSKLNKTNE